MDTNLIGGLSMTKQSLLSYCLNTYGTSPDYPFDEAFETAVLRHADNHKWYAVVMRVSRCKFGPDSDEVSIRNYRSRCSLRILRSLWNMIEQNPLYKTPSPSKCSVPAGTGCGEGA